MYMILISILINGASFFSHEIENGRIAGKAKINFQDNYAGIILSALLIRHPNCTVL